MSYVSTREFCKAMLLHRFCNLPLSLSYTQFNDVTSSHCGLFNTVAGICRLDVLPELKCNETERLLAEKSEGRLQAC